MRTELCDFLGIKHPIMLAGMGSVSGADLCAAVSNAGGIGTLGGGQFTPDALRKEIVELKQQLQPGKPFGVDLLLPQVGGNARKTNKDYTGGNLPKLVDIMIEEKTNLFVCAVGVPPRWAVEKLHAAGIICANCIGAPHHVQKALDVGIDLIIATGTEAGGHTGDIATLPLIPQCVDLCKGKKNYFGSDVFVVAAGGIYDGRGLSAALCLGAVGVWVGTRFIACKETNASPVHVKRVLESKSLDCARSEMFTGRPARVMRTEYFKYWEARPAELKQMLSEGKIPFARDLDTGKAKMSDLFPAIMGQIAGAITDVKSAKDIIDEMIKDANGILSSYASSKL